MADEKQLVWEQRPGESARAYAAFCLYRDLGPARSLTSAWARHTGREDGSRAPGQWSDWCTRYRWVERAEAWDAHLDAERRAARTAALRVLEERRARFEMENQERLERRVRRAEAVLDKADGHPITDVTQEKATVGQDGKLKTEKTKVKGVQFSGYARLMEAVNETARQAIEGVRENVGKAEEGRPSVVNGKFVWVPPSKDE